MNTSEIQRIIDEQRKKSKLHKMGNKADRYIERVEISRNLAKDPEWRTKNAEKNKQQADDLEWLKKVSDNNKQQAQNPAWIEANRIGAKKRAENPEWRKKNAEGNKKRANDPVWIEANRKGSIQAMKTRSENSEWYEKQKQAGKTRSNDPKWRNALARANNKPILTPEGVFSSIREAGNTYNIIKNFKNGGRWVKNQITKDPENFRHITWEEYDKLKETEEK